MGTIIVLILFIPTIIFCIVATVYTIIWSINNETIHGEVLETKTRLEIKHYQTKDKRYSSYQNICELVVLDEKENIRLVTLTEKDYNLFKERCKDKEFITFTRGQSKKLEKKELKKEVKEV
jgi:hypothetical protein